MLKQCNLGRLSQPVTSCTRNGTKHSNKNVKVIHYVTKKPCTVVIARPVILRPQSGAIFTRKESERNVVALILFVEARTSMLP